MAPPARPRRSAASASKVIVDSPASELSSLPDEAEADVKPKPTAKVRINASPKKANGKGKVVEAVSDELPKAKGKDVKRAKAEPDEDGEQQQPKKKAKVAKASIFPPADLDPSLHPTRKGHPVFRLSDLPDGVARNGGLAATGATQPMLLGAHTSIAGGPATALLKAGMLGANGLAMFVKSQRQWKSKDYEDEAVERFRTLMKPKEDGGAYNTTFMVAYSPNAVRLTR